MNLHIFGMQLHRVAPLNLQVAHKDSTTIMQHKLANIVHGDVIFVQIVHYAHNVVATSLYITDSF